MLLLGSGCLFKMRNMSKFDTDKSQAFGYIQFMVTGFTVQEEKNNSINKPSVGLYPISDEVSPKLCCLMWNAKVSLLRFKMEESRLVKLR